LKEEHIISKSMAETYWHEFCNVCHFEDGASDILNHLHGSYKLGVITNGIGEAQRSRLQKGEIAHFFDSLIISDEVECWKPDKVIFEKALGDLGFETKEVLFIGDSLTDDYQGSLSAGIDFCYYNKHNQHLDKAIKPKFVIRELAEIKNNILV
jgi:2-haloacid dehalogenase